MEHLYLTKIRVKLSYNGDGNVWQRTQITLGKSLVSWVDVSAAQSGDQNFINLSAV